MERDGDGSNADREPVSNTAPQPEYEHATMGPDA